MCVCKLLEEDTGVNRIMKPQRCEATVQELVTPNELLFCLTPLDYCIGSRLCEFIHIF